GGAPAELRLGDTVEARHLRALLERHRADGSAPGIRLDRMILAGGGGQGFHWSASGLKPKSGVATTAPAGTTRVPPVGSSASRPSTPASTGKPPRTEKD